MDHWLPTLPWWTFVVRGAVAYVGLLALMRLAGRHSALAQRVNDRSIHESCGATEGRRAVRARQCRC